MLSNWLRHWSRLGSMGTVESVPPLLRALLARQSTELWLVKLIFLQAVQTIHGRRVQDGPPCLNSDNHACRY